MTGGGLLVLLGVGRMLGYLGFAAYAGLWTARVFGLTGRPGRPGPPGRADATDGPGRRLERLQRSGLIVLAAGTLLDLVGAGALIAVGQTDVPVDLVGGAALARLAVLAAAVFLLPELLSTPGRTDTLAARGAVLLVVGLLTLTLVVAGPLIRGPHWVVDAVTAAWQLVGLAALAGAGLSLLTDRPAAPARARLVIRIGSVVVGVAALAGLVSAVVTADGVGAAVALVVGLAVVLVLFGLVAGVRSVGRPGAGPRSPGAALLAAGLSVGAVVLIVSSWLPGQIV